MNAKLESEILPYLDQVANWSLAKTSAVASFGMEEEEGVWEEVWGEEEVRFSVLSILS